MKEQFEGLIQSYIEQQVGIDQAFLSERLAEGLLQHIQQLQSEQLMKPAGIGNNLLKDASQQTRGDKIYWLDKSHSNPFEQEFLLLIESLILYLNQTCYAGIQQSEFHYAVYEKGQAYHKHIDQFKNDDDRQFSLVCYLNKDWKEADGGQLWLHHANQIQKISPEQQSAVFFKSNEMEHEVRAASRDRMSVTGWLKKG
jgi:Rps23 Pro-64 3,4-dihydroxylase Tpa1-like proline 4-hydroxylase